jgi:hypothetical protein
VCLGNFKFFRLDHIEMAMSMIISGPYRLGAEIVKPTKWWGSYQVFALDAQSGNPKVFSGFAGSRQY